MGFGLIGIQTEAARQMLNLFTLKSTPLNSLRLIPKEARGKFRLLSFLKVNAIELVVGSSLPNESA